MHIIRGRQRHDNGAWNSVVCLTVKLYAAPVSFYDFTRNHRLYIIFIRADNII